MDAWYATFQVLQNRTNPLASIMAIDQIQPACFTKVHASGLCPLTSQGRRSAREPQDAPSDGWLVILDLQESISQPGLLIPVLFNYPCNVFQATHIYLEENNAEDWMDSCVAPAFQ